MQFWCRKKKRGADGKTLSYVLSLISSPGDIPWGFWFLFIRADLPPISRNIWPGVAIITLRGIAGPRSSCRGNVRASDPFGVGILAHLNLHHQYNPLVRFTYFCNASSNQGESLRGGIGSLPHISRAFWSDLQRTALFIL